MKRERVRERERAVEERVEEGERESGAVCQCRQCHSTAMASTGPESGEGGEEQQREEIERRKLKRKAQAQLRNDVRRKRLGGGGKTRRQYDNKARQFAYWMWCHWKTRDSHETQQYLSNEFKEAFPKESEMDEPAFGPAGGWSDVAAGRCRGDHRCWRPYYDWLDTQPKTEGGKGRG